MSLREASAKPELLRLEAPGWSHPELPVLVWRGAVPAGDAEAIEAVLARNGWRPEWRNGVYPFHHFHSTAHEALACATGSAKLTLGGPDGQQVDVQAGDLMVLPAGTGHKRESASDDFLLVGAYPLGQQWDVCRHAADAAALARIEAVLAPSSDPLGGPLAKVW